MIVTVVEEALVGVNIHLDKGAMKPAEPMLN
jgi:hypothetical protein